MDAATGTLLYAINRNDPIPPASLTKLMTAHLALAEVAAERASLDEIVPLPRETWAENQPPHSSLMFLAANQRVSLRELLLGLAIPSGNDAAVAVALRFAPSVEDFVRAMNREARNFGLTETRFVEPSGVSELNTTTALEFALLCRAYITLHPEAMKEYHSIPEFAYPKTANVPPGQRAGTYVQKNHNSLLGRLEGVDGLKTGYINESGYNIALTAERGGTRFIAVLLGALTDQIRDDDGVRLLTWGFDNFRTLNPVAEYIPPVRIWKGKAKYASLTPAEALTFTVSTRRGLPLRWSAELEDNLTAPLPAGSPGGTLILSDDRGELRRIPLVLEFDAEQGGFFKRFGDSIGLFFKSLGEKLGRLFSKLGT
jgi:D-alanyl-D-alanine carboxypeptidase (penicillin-binding protein 5/6)